MEDDCDCLEELKKREGASAPPAASEARGQRRSSAEACTPTCKAAIRPGSGPGPARSPGFFSRLLAYFTRCNQRPRPIPHDCLNPKTNARNGRNPILALLTFIMGSVLLYIAIAYLLCAMQKYEMRARLASLFAFLGDPCAVRSYVNDLFTSAVARVSEAGARISSSSMSISGSSGDPGSSKKACKPKPKPACT